MKRYLAGVGLGLSLCSWGFADYQQGQAWFITDSTAIDPQAPILYPQAPATTPTGATTLGSNAAVPSNYRNSLPSNQLQPNLPFRLRSWLGGALWGTSTAEPDFYGPIPADGNFSASRTWSQVPLPQNAVYTDNYFLQLIPVSQTSCGSVSTTPNTVNILGISLNGVYPYLAATGSWPATVPLADPLNVTAQVQLHQDLMVVASNNPPPPNGGGVTSGLTFQPQTMYIDRMGDFDADIVYTFDYPNASAYSYTSFATSAGVGSYIKMSVCQGSPFIWCESCNVPYIFLRNFIGAGSPPFFKGETTPAPIAPGSNIYYTLIYGNVNYPGGGQPLNAIGSCDNFTTWAIYWVGDTVPPVTYTLDTQNPSLGQHNNSLNIPGPLLTDKFYFVIAQLPVQRAYPTEGVPYNLELAQTQAEQLGPYAFNYIINTDVSYTVSNGNLVTTTFQVETYNPITAGSNGPTVLTLEPHHYQSVNFGNIPGTNTNVAWEILNLNGSSLFNLSTGYWCPRGDLLTILGTSFKTNYMVSNLLQCMPPPDYSRTFTPTNNNATLFANTPIGEFLFWALDYDFANDVNTNINTAPAGGCWGNIAYKNVSTSSYGTAFALQYEARHLGLLQGMLQYLVNANGGAQVTSPPLLYQEDQSTNGAQRWIPNPTGPGVAPFFPTWRGTTTDAGDRPGYDMAAALQKSTQEVQYMIQNLFPQTPTPAANPSPAGTTTQTGNDAIIPCPLDNFAYYDLDTGMLVNHPVATGLSSESFPTYTNSVPQYSGSGCPGPAIPSANTLGVVNEGFGVGSNWNDHHYHWGYWISSAALATIYDSAWDPQNPSVSVWASGSQFGPAIDAMVMDLAFDPSVDGVTGGFYRNPSMNFAKMNFFDQWSGHGWADGFQACNAGGGTGHNENSQEGSQPFAAIAMWGIATGRKPIADLGLYLYATASYAFDFYMLDKNLNLLEGGSSAFVPKVTSSDGSHAVGTSYGDYILPCQGASACPQIQQTAQVYATDFGNDPISVQYVMCFPFAPWTLAIARNNEYMQNWVGIMETSLFKSGINPTGVLPNVWNNSFVPNMLLLQAAINDPNPAIPDPTNSQTWLQWFLDQATATNPEVPNYDPPWAGTWTGGGNAAVTFSPAMNVGLMPIADVIQFLSSCNDYGALDWTATAISSGASSGNYLFAATFAKRTSGLTTFVAFNPYTTPQSVTFYRTYNSTFPLYTLANIPPKSWAISPPVIPPTPTPPNPPVPPATCGNGGNLEDRLYDRTCLRNIYNQVVKKARAKIE